MLDNKGVSYEIIDLTDQPEKIQEMKTQFGWMTIPIIVINDQLIGGYNDLKALEQDGQLDSLLGI
jgi:glutaredoxin 3